MSDDVSVGVEIAPPDFIAENDGLLRAGLVIFSCEIPAKRRRDPNDFEYVLRHITAGVTLRSIFVGNVDCRSAQVTRHHRKRFLCRLEIFVILGGRNIAVPKVIVLIARLGIDQSNACELFRMRKRETTQHHRVNHGELRGSGTDAQAKHQHC